MCDSNPAAAAQVEKRNVNKDGRTVLCRAGGGGGGQLGKYALQRQRQTSLYLERLTYLTNVAIIYTSVILYTINTEIITCNRIVAEVSLEETW